MTMTFRFGKKTLQNNVDYKARLEHKLYLARENPEPIFDLSECNLKSVPSGIFSLCKVFRKERLLLQVNQLTSLSGGGHLSDLCLLTVLDLHSNRFSSVPEDIGYLINLQELNISFNELRKLPETIGLLLKLRELNCSHNKLRCLPPCLGQLPCLTSLDIRNNPNLNSLPSTISQVTHLEQLLVDEHLLEKSCLTEPAQSTSVIVQNNAPKYIPEQVSQSADQSQQSVNTQRMITECYSGQDSFELLEKKKEEKMREFLEMERNLQEQKGKEYEMHKNLKQDKNKLLMTLKEQQRKLEEDVTRLQLQKEQERTRLLSYLVEVESQTEQTITDLLALNQALHQSSQWQEQDRLEQELLDDYKSRNSHLRRQEVIDAMQSLLAEEYSRKEKLLAYEKTRAETIQNSLSREVEWSQQVSSLISDRDARQSALLSAVEADTELQKELVATLLERSDMRSQSLVIQVAMVEHQLAVLTSLELQRRNMDYQQHLNDLAEKRKTLSDLLVELLHQQSMRRNHLVQTLQQLDTDRQVCESSTDFWLQQYQRLLDVRPPQLKTALDPELVHELVTAGVAHCLPFLTCCQIDSLTQDHLLLIGVSNVDDQLAILKAVSAYLKHKEAQSLVPSAPPDEERSAPPVTECVVCMESECAIVFVPCGHLCTCAACASRLALCPLCRAHIQRKIHTIIS